jgi:beta-glucosidase
MNQTNRPDAAARYRALPFIAGLLVASAAAASAQAPAASPAKFDKAKIKGVVAAMTLEEKAGLVVGEGGGGFGPPQAPPAAGAPAAPAPQAQGASPSGILGQTQRLVPGAAGTTYAVPRLGITPSVLADGPAGLRWGRCSPPPGTPIW